MNFLWEGPAKIKQEVLIKQYSEGGLKNVKYKSIYISTKSNMDKKAYNKKREWQNIVNKLINLRDIVNLGDVHARQVSEKIGNKFWADVIKAFSDISKCNTPTSATQFLTQPLFHNENIIVGGKTAFIKPWYNKGITLINDITNENGNFYSLEEFNKIYNLKTNFLTYHGITSSIKKKCSKE